MKFIYKKASLQLILLSFVFSIIFSACQTHKAVEVDEYLIAKIDQQSWKGIPFSPIRKFSVSYKTLSHQLTILGEAKDGSRISISFHGAGPLKAGRYPSTLSDEGVQSCIFYAPEQQSTGNEMSSVTYDTPVQENTVDITKLDKSDPKAYLIEGNFSSITYALYKSNPKRTSYITGKFKVRYYIDAYHPSF